MKLTTPWWLPLTAGLTPPCGCSRWSCLYLTVKPIPFDLSSLIIRSNCMICKQYFLLGVRQEMNAYVYEINASEMECDVTSLMWVAVTQQIMSISMLDKYCIWSEAHDITYKHRRRMERNNSSVGFYQSPSDGICWIISVLSNINIQNVWHMLYLPNICIININQTQKTQQFILITDQDFIHQNFINKFGHVWCQFFKNRNLMLKFTKIMHLECFTKWKKNVFKKRKHVDIENVLKNVIRIFFWNYLNIFLRRPHHLGVKFHEYFKILVFFKTFFKFHYLYEGR